MTPFDFYVACILGGVFSYGLTHTGLTPLDLLKCNMQVLLLSWSVQLSSSEKNFEKRLSDRSESLFPRFICELLKVCFEIFCKPIELFKEAPFEKSDYSWSDYFCFSY